MIRLALAAPLMLAAAAASAQTAEEVRQPFEVLRAGTAAKDAGLAASAYGPDAVLVFEYGGASREEHVGDAAILASYHRTFAPLKPEWPVDINFKLDAGAPDASTRTGAYRITVDTGGRTIATYGRFEVTLRKVGDRWLFVRDAGREATAADYAAVAGPELFTD
jgi:ketosteroid isomerase-like protein